MLWSGTGWNFGAHAAAVWGEDEYVGEGAADVDSELVSVGRHCVRLRI